MYAIIKTGGKQYKVSEGDMLRVEKIDGSAGDKVELDNVLLIGEDENVEVGMPIVAGSKVIAKIVEQGKAKKIIVFKTKRRKGYRKKRGHRQLYTSLKIEGIKKEKIN